MAHRPSCSRTLDTPRTAQAPTQKGMSVTNMRQPQDPRGTRPQRPHSTKQHVRQLRFGFSATSRRAPCCAQKASATRSVRSLSSSSFSPATMRSSWRSTQWPRNSAGRAGPSLSMTSRMTP